MMRYLLYNDMQASLIKRLKWDHHMKIYIDKVIVLSSVLFGSYKASSSHEALNSVFKSHYNTPVTWNVSISQSWIVRRGSNVTFNLNTRHHTVFFFSSQCFPSPFRHKRQNAKGRWARAFGFSSFSRPTPPLSLPFLFIFSALVV